MAGTRCVPTDLRDWGQCSYPLQHDCRVGRTSEARNGTVSRGLTGPVRPNGRITPRSARPARTPWPASAATIRRTRILRTGDGAGEAADNVHRDPQQGAQLNRFIQRNTPAVFGLGGLQRLGEEMTADLQAQTATARNTTCRCGSTSTGTSCNVSLAISSKGVNFGTFRITRAATATACSLSITPAVSGRRFPSPPTSWFAHSNGRIDRLDS